MITKEMLSEAMCDIDADLIAEHVERTSPRKISRSYALAIAGYAAACLVVALILPILFQKAPGPDIPSNPIDTETYNSETMPPVPDTETDVTDTETSETETEPPVTEPDNTVTWEEIEKGKYADMMGYLEILTKYIHEPYNKGDYIGDKHLLYMCMLYAMQTSDSFDTVVKDEAESIVTVSEEELDTLCRTLFGDDISIHDYDRQLFMYPSDYTSAHDSYLITGEWPEGKVGCSARFLKDGIYTFTTATDYWYEEPYNINRGYDPVIEVDGDKIHVTVHLFYKEATSVGQVKYTFTPVTDEKGVTRYRLLQIEGGTAYEPRQWGCVEEYVNATLDESGNVIGFDWGNTGEIDVTSIYGVSGFYMKIPSVLKSAEGKWKCFLRWDPETQSYVRSLEHIMAFRVPKDATFTLDGTIYEMTALSTTVDTSPPEVSEPVIGVNSLGVPYVLYSSGSMRYIYFEHTVDGDRYITCFSYAVEDTDELMYFVESMSPCNGMLVEELEYTVMGDEWDEKILTEFGLTEDDDRVLFLKAFIKKDSAALYRCYYNGYGFYSDYTTHPYTTIEFDRYTVRLERFYDGQYALYLTLNVTDVGQCTEMYVGEWTQVPILQEYVGIKLGDFKTDAYANGGSSYIQNKTRSLIQGFGTKFPPELEDWQTRARLVNILLNHYIDEPIYSTDQLIPWMERVYGFTFSFEGMPEPTYYQEEGNMCGFYTPSGGAVSYRFLSDETDGDHTYVKVRFYGDPGMLVPVSEVTYVYVLRDGLWCPETTVTEKTFIDYPVFRGRGT